MITRLLRTFILLGFGFAAGYVPLSHGMVVPSSKTETTSADRVKEFVHTELRNSGLNNPESVSILLLDKYEASRREIHVPGEQLATILKEKKERKFETNDDFSVLLEDLKSVHVFDVYKEAFEHNFSTNATHMNKRFAKELDHQYACARGAIAHEAGHIKNSGKERPVDILIDTVLKAPVVAALVTCSATYFIQDKEEKDFFQRMCSASLRASSHALLAMTLLSNAYSRTKERRADDNVPNDIELLRAQQEYFRRAHRDAGNRLNNGNAHLTDVLDTAPVINAFVGDHPTHKEREENFKKRADGLEQGKL